MEYRRCASVMVFRPSNVCTPDGCETLYEILLVHKPRKRDSWQLPQGGIENGESLEQAALRELQEETGVIGRVFGKSNRVYQYDFPKSYRRFRPDNVIGQRVEYVFSEAGDAPVVTVDDKEIDAYVWVLPEQLSQYLKRKEYLGLVRNLYSEGREKL